MHKIAEKSTIKLCTRLGVFNRRQHSLQEIATYKLKTVEKLVTEVNDRNNSRLFNASIGTNESRRKYTSILPPPNVTGNLHLGHVLMATVQDAICRWKSLNGFDVQWIPGLDHAGIATQVVVEKSLKSKKGLTRHDIGRTAFLQETWKWKEEKGHQIRDDLIRLGTIFNWEREYFTMDENMSQAVVEAFVRLFEADMIYRSKAMINWSCSLESAISDIEVETIDINGPTKLSIPRHSRPVTFGHIYEFAYRSMDGDEEIVVATTRPETILGDVAIAVSPDDVRYSHLRGKQFWHPFRDEPILLVFDEMVDPGYGTGAVKITPAHDKDDFEVAKRHRLPIIPIFDERGMVLDVFTRFAQMPRFDAREAILHNLATAGLFRSKKEHKMKLPRCSRSQDVVEYFAKAQWFMRCKGMEEAAMEAVEQGELAIDPPKFDKEWNHWLGDHRDWCLSRQLWWGHRIPAYECILDERTIWVAAASEEQARLKAEVKFGVTDAAGIQVRQDEDVLDTWFSSGVLPFAVFGWPAGDFSDEKKSYPLDILVTGHDILFFWVARMTMLGAQLTEQLPFQKILLHGIVCDANGRKMSKSRGNVVTPSQIINGATYNELVDDLRKSHREGVISAAELKESIKEKRRTFPKGIPECGTDALRFTLCSSDIRDHFITFHVNECHSNKLFFNKIWNATRFTLDNCVKFAVDPKATPAFDNNSLTDFDKWILSRLATTLTRTRSAMDNFEFHLATSAWRRFFYENLCDVYLETTKTNFWKAREPFARGQCEVLKTCLAAGLKHMGIFTPFLANELLKHLPSIDTFPVEVCENKTLEEDISELMEICGSIRQLKSENNITIKHSPRTHLFSTDDRLLGFVEKHNEIVNFITFSIETIVHPFPVTDFSGSGEFLVQSTAARSCTFGITVENAPSTVESDVVTNARNKKKLDNLLQTLEYQRKLVKRFEKRGDEVPASFLENIEKTEIEIEILKRLMKS